MPGDTSIPDSISVSGKITGTEAVERGFQDAFNGKVAQDMDTPGYALRYQRGKESRLRESIAALSQLAGGRPSLKSDIKRLHERLASEIEKRTPQPQTAPAEDEMISPPVPRMPEFVSEEDERSFKDALSKDLSYT